jgi:hypothetical protein
MDSLDDQNRDQWKTLVNMVMNFQVPQNVGKVLSSCKLAASRDRISSMELVRLL